MFLGLFTHNVFIPYPFFFSIAQNGSIIHTGNIGTMLNIKGIPTPSISGSASISISRGLWLRLKIDPHLFSGITIDLHCMALDAVAAAAADARCVYPLMDVISNTDYKCYI